MFRRFGFACLASIAFLAVAACGRAAPDAGEEGVLIQKPWFFGHGGVDPTPVQAGLSFTAFTTDTVYVNVQPMTIKEHFGDLMSKDGVPLSFDCYIKVRVTDSVALVRDFGGGLEPVPDEHSEVKGETDPYWYYSNLKGPARNIVRDIVRKYGLNEVAITYTADAQIEAEGRREVAEYIHSRNLPLVLLDFSMGKANPPDSVRDQRVRTASEQQRQITEKQTQFAEEARKGAETARAAADNAYRNALGLSPEQFIQLQQIDMQRTGCKNNHCVFVSPGTSALVGIAK